MCNNSESKLTTLMRPALITCKIRRLRV